MKIDAPESAQLLAREQAIRRETEILRDANIVLTEGLSLKRVVESLLDFLNRLIPYDSANVMLRNKDSQFIVSAWRRYEEFQDVEPTCFVAFDANTNPILQRICSTKQSVIVADTHREAGWQWVSGATHVRNWLGVPLVASGKVIGLYSVDKAEPFFFQPEHVRLAETLAARAASAIQNAQLFEQSQHYMAELEERIAERKRAEVALHESEERYRELFENARDAIYVHDLEGNYIRVNHAAETLSGYKREEIVGHNFVEFISAKQLGFGRKSFYATLAEQGETAFEVDVLAKDGRRVPVEVRSRAIYENGVMVGVQGTARDITEHKLAQDALQRFSRQLIEAQEDERRRISRELHDQIGQILTAIKMNLYSVPEVLHTAEASSYVKDNIEAVDEALRLVRDLSIDLRPPVLDDFGLVTALCWYVDRYTKRTGLEVDVVIEMPDQKQRLSRDLETACFRIAQEALTNIVRHAQASRVLLQLVRDGNVLLLSIKDDGVGFDLESLRKRAPRAATLGLISMQERAHAAGGTIEIVSARARGTEIRFSLNLAP
ncbi:MAG TPA: PAS domain S-box protein [Pyrinomonadaceae bacterium]|jgi:PAS domain S-box-containing protein|nr:PAS domain S-box protein [Pyrinomonadaceae bacterium]